MTETASAKTSTALVGVAFPAPAPASAAPATSLEGVALLTLDRPEVLNALNFDLLDELADALEMLDGDPPCRAVVITGAGDRAFAAGADIGELATQSPTSLAAGGRFGAWDRIAAVGVPMIAAVRGFALGGGCELAMACDMIVAADDAQFGQPEIRIGVMPGAGGTQRLTRAIGKQRAMEYVLTGRHFNAQMAAGWGLVNRAIPKGAWLTEAVELARTVAARPPIATRLAKQAVLAAEEEGLSAGLRAERRLFEETMATEDRIEGMTAFSEKREPDFKGR